MQTKAWAMSSIHPDGSIRPGISNMDSPFAISLNQVMEEFSPLGAKSQGEAGRFPQSIGEQSSQQQAWAKGVKGKGASQQLDALMEGQSHQQPMGSREHFQSSVLKDRDLQKATKAMNQGDAKQDESQSDCAGLTWTSSTTELIYGTLYLLPSSVAERILLPQGC